MALRRLPLLLVALLATALLLVLGAIVLVRQLTAAHQWVSHTYEAQLTTEKLFGALRDAETGQRGYLLTSDPGYLEPYDTGAATATLKLAELRHIVSDNPAQLPRLAKLEELMAAKLAELNATISAQRAGAPAQALDLVRNNNGKRLMDAIRLEIANVNDTESALLNDRIKASNQTQAWLRWTGLFALVALIGLGTALSVLFTQRLVELQQAVADHTLHLGIVTAELTHRTKNQLALVQSIANQTARHSLGIPDFLEKFGERLQALSRSTTELTRHQWHSANLHDLFAAQVAWLPPAIARNRITVVGPRVLLTPTAAHYLGLAIHELTTNALKYGALSNDAGHISVIWSTPSNIQGSPSFKLTWSETGGPRISAPPDKASTGFGSKILERLTATALQGTAHCDYQPDGLIWTLEASLADIEGEQPPNENMSEMTAAAPHDARSINP